jgi:hypothetical protein
MTWNEILKQIESNLEQTKKNMIIANENAKKISKTVEKLNNDITANEVKQIKCRKMQVEIKISYEEAIL